MTTAQILKRLEAARSEEELLAVASELGVTPSFFNVGSVTEGKANSPSAVAVSKPVGKRKRFGYSLKRPKKPLKKTAVVVRT